MSETVVETVSSLPSGDPVSSSAPASAPVPTPSVMAPLGAALAAAPSNADAFIAHLHRCMQSRAGADVVLLFLCYTSRLTGTVLESLSRPVLQQAARRLVAMAFKMPASTTVVMSAAPVPTAAAYALRLSGSLNALASMLSEWRCMNRLFGLLGIYFSVKKLLLKTFGASKNTTASEKEKSVAQAKPASEERFDTALAYAQVIALVSFQAAENVAFLSSKKVLGLAPATQGKLAVFSVRAWGCYVGMEAGRLLIERSRKLSSNAGDDSWKVEWKKSFTRNLAWAPLTIHWGMPNGPLPDMVVAMLASYPAVGHMMDLWKGTA